MRTRPVRSVAVLLLFSAAPLFAADRILEPACDLAIHEELVELEDAQLEVELARTRFAAFERIFGLIDELWKADATTRMAFLRAKYDRDAARLGLERADLLLERQETLVEFYRTICGAGKEGASGPKLRERYLHADCGQQVKAAEVAVVNLEFNREWLASMRDLRAGDVATIQDVIAAELEVELEEQRLADAERRAAECRKDLNLEDEPASDDG